MSLIGIAVDPGSTGIVITQVNAMGDPGLEGEQDIQPSRVDLVPIRCLHSIVSQRQIGAVCIVGSEVEAGHTTEVLDREHVRAAALYDSAAIRLPIDKAEFNAAIQLHRRLGPKARATFI